MDIHADITSDLLQEEKPKSKVKLKTKAGKIVQSITDDIRLTKKEIETIVKDGHLAKYLIRYRLFPYFQQPTIFSKKIKTGLIKTKLPKSTLDELSLNRCINLGTDTEFVMHFIQTLEEKLPHCDLSNFYKNIKTLKIEHKSESERERGVPGERDGWHNIVTLYTKECCDKDQKSITAHELLHVASSKKGKIIHNSGFKKTIKLINHLFRKKLYLAVGKGLNEGYTELLTKRLFNYFTPQRRDIYDIEQFLAYGIEQIVGQKEMEKAYFDNDLEGVVDNLAQDIGEENANNLIIKIDEILRIRKKSQSFETAEKLAREVRVDIANILLTRVKRKHEAGELSEEELVKRVYDLELYINEFAVYSFANKDVPGENVSIVPIPEPMRIHKSEIVAKDVYTNLAQEYYNSKIWVQGFTTEPWRNSKGKTTEEIIQELYDSSNKKTNSQSQEIAEMLNETETAAINKSPSSVKIS